MLWKINYLTVNMVENQQRYLMTEDLNLIEALCVEVDCIGIKHIFRESNSLADVLAISGSKRGSNIWAFYGQRDRGN